MRDIKDIASISIDQQPLGLLMDLDAPTFNEGIKLFVNDHIFASSRLRVNQYDHGQSPVRSEQK